MPSESRPYIDCPGGPEGNPRPMREWWAIYPPLPQDRQRRDMTIIGSKFFRVTWEQRTKPQCVCCVDENHLWYPQVENAQSVRGMEDIKDRIYGYTDQEIRSVHEEFADVSEWQEYHQWEHVYD